MAFIFDTSKGETPETIKRKRDLIRAIMGASRAPQNVGEGLNALGDGIVANVLDRRANRAESEGTAGASSLFENIMSGLTGGGMGGFPAAPSAPSSGGQANPVDMSGNEVFSGFMDTVKTGVSNPYALAAIAATGKHESGFSPQNVNRTWSDPSQSGQPGTAGGIMSWRGPRYQGLAKTGDLSPQGQANYFLQEDPKLIAALNNAQSVEEAQALMNNAWRFAGYNRQGGEAARRLQTARSLLPTFQGGQAPAQAASAGNDEAMLAAYAAQGIAPMSAEEAATPLLTPAQRQANKANVQRMIEQAQGGPLPLLDDMFDARAGGPPTLPMGPNGAPIVNSPVQVAGGEADIQALEAQMAQQDPQAFQMPPQMAPQPDPMAFAPEGGLPPQMPQPGNVPMPQQAMPQLPAQQPPVQMAQAERPIPPMAGGPAPAIQQTGPSLQQLMQAAQNPWLNDNQRAVVNMLLEQELKKQDPRYQLETDNLRGQIGERDRRYDFDREKFEFDREKAARTSDINEYEYARQQGYQGTFAEFQIEQKKAGATNVTTNVGGENLTPGQKKIDEAFADTYLSWQAGGFADSTKQLSQLNESLGILESGENITGVIGTLPDFVQPFINERGTIAKEQVEEVVQRNLREILGAQFTEKEGERLISRAFNPRLKPEENAKRVRRLIGQISSMAEAKQGMVDYFDENGTLRGYKGPRPTMNDLNKIDFGDEPKPAQGDDLDKLLEMYGD